MKNISYIYIHDMIFANCKYLSMCKYNHSVIKYVANLNEITKL